ncbi:helix-turn-helix transcriptional regulator [Chloroflexota bacterium]
MKNRMKEYRARLGLTQEKLAEIAGVRRETIIYLEKGKYNPSLKLASTIARALEASIEDIFILDDD